MKIHPSITATRIIEAVEHSQSVHCLGNLGFCVLCGLEVQNVEPDAHGHLCPRCGKRTVYAVDDLLALLALPPKDSP